MDACPVRAEQVLDGHGRPLRTTLSRPSDCAKYEITLDVALHFGPEDHSCAEKLNKNNDQVGRETLQLFKSGSKAWISALRIGPGCPGCPSEKHDCCHGTDRPGAWVTTWTSWP